jgi:hypothetical protein
MSDRIEAPASGDGPAAPDPGFPSRLKLLVADFGSVNSLAKAIGRSEGAVRKWLRGESEPAVRDVRGVCERCRVNVEWLVSGRGRREAGSPYLQESPPDYRNRETPGPFLGALDTELLEAIIRAVDEAAAAGEPMLPAKKRALLVATLYGLFRESGKADPETVTRLVRLAS